MNELGRVSLKFRACLGHLLAPNNAQRTQMNFEAIWQDYWKMLYSDLEQENEFPEVSPLLCHYTSMQNLENILAGEEVWLSNPLYMNDLEEVRFGVNTGFDLVMKDDGIRSALGSDERAERFFNTFAESYDEYAREHVLDLYVMCFSIHEDDDQDGRLSMWRGYGQNGKGAAVVFDTSKVKAMENSPLALAPVHYASVEDRIARFDVKIQEVAHFLENNRVPLEYVHATAQALFQRICLYAVFSKHIGFKEENEWRLVYLKDRDLGNALHPYFSYLNGSDGIQPKLKLPMGAIPGVISDEFRLSDVVHSIIIGPSASSPLTQASIKRMLTARNKPELIERLRMSSIPFRAT